VFSLAFFRNAIAFVNGNGNLCVSFTEKELFKEVKYILSAYGTANFDCIHEGGDVHVVASQSTVSAFLSREESIKPRHGKIEATLCTDNTFPTYGDLNCPLGQNLVLRSISYHNIVLKDTTNGIAVNLSDASRQFSS
jgi:hypothetical protein